MQKKSLLQKDGNYLMRKIFRILGEMKIEINI